MRPAAYMHHQQFRIARAHSHAFIRRFLDEILDQATLRHLCMYAASCKYVALTVYVCGGRSISPDSQNSTSAHSFVDWECVH